MYPALYIEFFLDMWQCGMAVYVHHDKSVEESFDSLSRQNCQGRHTLQILEFPYKKINTHILENNGLDQIHQDYGIVLAIAYVAVD